MYTNVDYDRRSLKNALFKGNFFRAFEKVNENITIIDNNISQLREYSLKIGSRQEKSEATEETNELIESTTKSIMDTMNYLSDIKEYNYVSSSEKMENINKAKSIEKTVQMKQKNFQNLVDQIKNQGQQYIENARDSLKNLNIEENKEIVLENNQQKLLNGREFIEGIHDKEQQINLIKDVTLKLNELSKQTSEAAFKAGETVNTIEDNVNQMSSNIANAVDHMKEAKKYNESATGGYTNYCLYCIGGVVLLLILIVIIMPS